MGSEPQPVATVYELVIDRVNVNQTTGQHELLVRIEETPDSGDWKKQIISSPPEVYGISQQELDAKYGGVVQQWVNQIVGPDMKQKHRARQKSHADAFRLRGTRQRV